MHVSSYPEKNEGSDQVKENEKNKNEDDIIAKKVAEEYMKTIFKKYSTPNQCKRRNYLCDGILYANTKKPKKSLEEKTKECESLEETTFQEAHCEYNLKKNDIIKRTHFQESFRPESSCEQKVQKEIKSIGICSKAYRDTLNDEEIAKKEVMHEHLNGKQVEKNQETTNNNTPTNTTSNINHQHIVKDSGDLFCKLEKENFTSWENKSAFQNNKIHTVEKGRTYPKVHFSNTPFFKKGRNSVGEAIASKAADVQKESILEEETLFETSSAIEANQISRRGKKVPHKRGGKEPTVNVENIIMHNTSRYTSSEHKGKNNDSKSKTGITHNRDVGDKLFTPKNSSILTTIQKKEIEKQLLQTINEENKLANSLSKMKNKGTTAVCTNKINTTELLHKALNSTKGGTGSNVSNTYSTNNTALNLISHLGINRSTKMNTTTNFHVNSTSNFHIYNSDSFMADNKLNFLLKKMHSGSTSGAAGGPMATGVGITGIGGGGSGNFPSFLRTSKSSVMGIDDELKINDVNNDYDYDEEVNQKLVEEWKKDICFLLREMISYCDYLKDRRKSDQSEITKIRGSYNQVCKLLKEALSRETHNQEQLLKLRENVEAYNEQLKNLQYSQDEHAKFYNKQIEELMNLNCKLEEKLQDIAAENHKLKKIAKTSLQYSTENNELKGKLEEINGEYSALLLENDYLKLENSKMENEKNVLVAEKNSIHCKLTELENEMKRMEKEKEKKKENIRKQMEENPFIINSDEELKEQIKKYLSLNAEQRIELFASFLEHWRSTNIEGQKYYHLAYFQENIMENNIQKDEDKEQEEQEQEHAAKQERKIRNTLQKEEELDDEDERNQQNKNIDQYQ